MPDYFKLVDTWLAQEAMAAIDELRESIPSGAYLTIANALHQLHRGGE